jgi:hypothetical protein
MLKNTDKNFPPAVGDDPNGYGIVLHSHDAVIFYLAKIGFYFTNG